MKDYYKILGVKENASKEKIRVRWIRLMRRFHPDIKGKKESEERRAKEINEAYQVLKDALARMEYDLKRNYYRQKNRLQHRRKGFLPGLAGVLLVIALVFALKFFPQIDSSNTQRAQKETTAKAASTQRAQEEET